MKKSTLLIILLLLNPNLYAQEWTELYTYNIENAFNDIPQVDVSKDDVIIVSLGSALPVSNGIMERSTDGGNSWTTLATDFRREFVGFDSSNNMYIVSAERFQSGINLVYKLNYSTDLGDSWQDIFDIPDKGGQVYYIDKDDKFYTHDFGYVGDFQGLMAVFLNGEETTQIYSPFDATSSSFRGLIKLNDDSYVASSFNSGVYYSNDGFTWNDSEGDDILGASTFTSFAEANNGTLFLAGVSLNQSSDGGENWTTSSLNLNFVSHLRKAANGTLYALASTSSPQLYESIDNGVTWLGIENEPGTEVKDFDVSDNFLYAIYEDNILYRRPVSEFLGTSESLSRASRFKAYPNPSDADVFIETKNYAQKLWHISIYNVLGQHIYEIKSNQNRLRIPHSTFNSSGMYFVQIKDKKGKPISQIKLIRTQ